LQYERSGYAVKLVSLLHLQTSVGMHFFIFPPASTPVEFNILLSHLIVSHIGYDFFQTIDWTSTDDQTRNTAITERPCCRVG